MRKALCRVALAAAFVNVAAIVPHAQQTSTSTQTKTFEILAVDGNQLVVSLPEGTKELTVPDDFRFTVNGQPLSVHQLRPGMKGTATITTQTTVTPVTVTEVKNGTVVQSSAGSIIVQTDQGYRAFSQGELEKRGVRIVKNGKPVDLPDLHKGDQLTATIVTEKPPRVVTQKEVQAIVGTTGTSSAAPPVAAARPSEAAPPEPSSTPKTLPTTASSWPLVGVLSALCLTMGAALTIRRRYVS